MPRDKQQLLARLEEQIGLLQSSLDAYYRGSLSEALRIATLLRVLVHESGSSKPLLKQLRSDYLSLPILDKKDPGENPQQENVVCLKVGLRIGPGPVVSSAVDLSAPFLEPTTLGRWWNNQIIMFPSQSGKLMNYSRKRVILILANKEGGAHLDPEPDPDYVKLITEVPLILQAGGAAIETPNLAKYVAAESGVELLDSLKRNYFPEPPIPVKWEQGDALPGATYSDLILIQRTQATTPQARIQISKRR